MHDSSYLSISGTPNKLVREHNKNDEKPNYIQVLKIYRITITESYLGDTLDGFN